MFKTVVRSVGGGIGEGRGREADLSVGDVVNIVEPLEERVSVDEVETLARVRPEVGCDEVDAVGIAANCSVELKNGRVRKEQNDRLRGTGEETYGTRPDLCVRRELVGGVTDVEEQALEVRELVRGELEQTRVVVLHGARDLLVCSQCVCSRFPI